MRILLAYASAHGSTAEIGQFMGDVLREQGLDVTTAPVITVKSIDDYDVFILGSPIHSGLWLPEMALFARRFRKQMAGCPIYVWITCIRVLESGGVEYALDTYLPVSLREELGVREATAFAGKLDFNKVNWNERWTLSVRYDGLMAAQQLQGDYRDWGAIRRWAEHVAEDLKNRS